MSEERRGPELPCRGPADGDGVSEKDPAPPRPGHSTDWSIPEELLADDRLDDLLDAIGEQMLREDPSLMDALPPDMQQQLEELDNAQDPPSDAPLTWGRVDRFVGWFQEKAIPRLINVSVVVFLILMVLRCVGVY